MPNWPGRGALIGLAKMKEAADKGGLFLLTGAFAANFSQMKFGFLPGGAPPAGTGFGLPPDLKHI